MKGRWITKTQLKKVNKALKEAGYSPYRGDSTTAYPDGCGAGYGVNLINHVAGADPDAQREVEKILTEVLD